MAAHIQGDSQKDRQVQQPEGTDPYILAAKIRSIEDVALEKLKDELRDFFLNSIKFSDITFTLTTDDNISDTASSTRTNSQEEDDDGSTIEFYGHKAILAARCEKFRALFCNGMMESRADQIPIHNVPQRTWQLMMEYLYTARYIYTHSPCLIFNCK